MRIIWCFDWHKMHLAVIISTANYEGKLILRLEIILSIMLLLFRRTIPQNSPGDAGLAATKSCFQILLSKNPTPRKKITKKKTKKIS